MTSSTRTIAPINSLDVVGYASALEDLGCLFHKAFGRPVTEDMLRWRYLKNPLNKILADVAHDNGKIIANYSASPMQMVIDDSVHLAALSMTTMTDPDHGGKGWFTRLAESLYHRMASDGYSMIWGFPNRFSHRGFMARLGWQDVYEIPTMSCKVNPGHGTTDDELVLDDAFKLEYAAIPQPARIHVRKDRNYMQWRYAHCPDAEYKNIVIVNDGVVSSHAVVKVYGDALDVVDFRMSTKEEGRALLAMIMSMAVGRKCQTVNLWAPRHHDMHPLCERAGFVNTSPITYLGFRQLSSGSIGLSTNYSDWFLQMGDSDVY